MCNVLVANAIVELLEQKILDGEVFTAYDLTLAVRKTTKDCVRHEDVRNILNNEFVTSQMAGYDRELCTLDLSNQPQAFVYFPDTKSASDHSLVNAPSGSISSHIGSPIITPSPTVILADDEVATTKEGRVQIPRKLTSQIKASPSGTYDLIINGTYKGAKADARGDIRVGLIQFGITDSKVKVTVDTTINTINVETV